MVKEQEECREEDKFEDAKVMLAEGNSFEEISCVTKISMERLKDMLLKSML
jgi:hypothetical protein